MADLPLTARGLLELRVLEHNQAVEVKKQELFLDAKGVVNRTGFLRVQGTEVRIDADAV